MIRSFAVFGWPDRRGRCRRRAGRVDAAWQSPPTWKMAVERLAHMPGNLGSWKAETVEFDAERLAEAGAGILVRRYTDARTGASVLVFCCAAAPAR